MRHARERHRPRAAEQLDLFGAGRSRSAERFPAWEALPIGPRAEMTALMSRLIVEHARTRGTAVVEAARHER